METRPKILILGNGFDLAHYLPTSYIHFMKAMMVLEESEVDTEINFDTLFADYIENNDWFIGKTKEIYKTDELILDVDIANDLREKLKTNGWFQYFKNYLLINTWIDFETQIEHVLKIIDLASVEINIQKVSNDNAHDEILISVLKENQVYLEREFPESLNIKQKQFLSLLNDFKILNSIFVIIEEYNHIQDSSSQQTVSRVDRSTYLETLEVRNQRTNSLLYLQNISKIEYQHIIDNKFLSRFKNSYIDFNLNEIYRYLSEDLMSFTDIFETYIGQVINKLATRTPFEYKGDVLGNPIEAVFTFNYSSSFERFYPNCKLKIFNYVQYLHGNADEKNAVLGITDLEDESLKKQKIYSFVKTYQKIINETDYDFLQDTELFYRKERLENGEKLGSCYEIIIWGHSLDSSDAEYIKELFKLNNQRTPTNIQITVWYHDKPHDLLANLMHIMGKDIIQEWMKRGWLRFEPSLTLV